MIAQIPGLRDIRRRSARRQGFNLVEVLVAVGILATAALAVVGVMPTMSSLTLDVQDTVSGLYLCESKLDQLVSLYDPDADDPEDNDTTDGEDWGYRPSCTEQRYIEPGYTNPSGLPVLAKPTNQTVCTRSWTYTDDAIDATDPALADYNAQVITVTVTWNERPNRIRSITLYGLVAPQ